MEGMEGQRNSGENAEGKMDRMAFSPQKTHREGEPALLERGTPGFRKDPVPWVLPGGALQEQCSGSAPFIPTTGVGIPVPGNGPAWLGLPRKGWKLFHSLSKNEFYGGCWVQLELGRVGCRVGAKIQPGISPISWKIRETASAAGWQQCCLPTWAFPCWN